MRLYIDSKIDTNHHFDVTDLHFADSKDFEGDLDDENVLTLYGVMFKLSDFEKCHHQSILWDGVALDKNNEALSITDVKELLQDKYLINASGYCDYPCTLSDIELKFSDDSGVWEFPKDRICEYVEILW